MLGAKGVLNGQTIGIDATTLEANAAMRSIVRRDTGAKYVEYLTGLEPGQDAVAGTVGAAGIIGVGQEMSGDSGLTPTPVFPSTPRNQLAASAPDDSHPTSDQSLDEWLDRALQKLNDPTQPLPRAW